MSHAHPDPQPANPLSDLPAWARPFHALARSPWFVNFITAVIVVASALAGMQTYDAISTRYGDLINTLDKVIIWVFVIELLIRLAAYGAKPWRFFLDGWNLFDFVIVVACLWPAEGGANQFATVLRLARLLRALRLFSAVPRLQVMIVALIKSIPAIFYVGLLLFLQFYIYAVIGTVVFGRNDPFHFGSLDSSMLTLFRVVTLEDWTDVMYWQMNGTLVSDADLLARLPENAPPMVATGWGYNDVARQITDKQWSTYTPRAFGWIATVYFVSFVMIGTMIALNLFVAVVLGGMSAAEKDQAAKLLADQPGGKDFPARLENIETKLADLLNDLGELRRTMTQAKKNGDT